MVVVVEEEEQVKRKPWRRAAPHVVVFPFPAQGHIRPFVHFSKRLAADYDIAITFITTTPHLESTRRELLLQLEEKKDEQEEGEEERFKAIYKTSNNNIQLACFHLPAEYAEVTSDNFLDLAQSVHNLQDSFAKLMKKLMMGSSSSACTIAPSSAMSSSTSSSHTESFQPPVCIISDMFLGWTQVCTYRRKLPFLSFASSPHVFVCLLLFCEVKDQTQNSHLTTP